MMELAKVAIDVNYIAWRNDISLLHEHCVIFERIHRF
jgi:hypothetical protein